MSFYLDIFGPLVLGLAGMGWSYYPTWRHAYRKWRRHRDWQRGPFNA